MPAVNQIKMMIQRLLADRFALTFHREQKELSVYAITVAKGGPKITKEENLDTGRAASSDTRQSHSGGGVDHSRTTASPQDDGRQCL